MTGRVSPLNAHPCGCASDSRLLSRPRVIYGLGGAPRGRRAPFLPPHIRSRTRARRESARLTDASTRRREKEITAANERSAVRHRLPRPCSNTVDVHTEIRALLASATRDSPPTRDYRRSIIVVVVDCCDATEGERLRPCTRKKRERDETSDGGEDTDSRTNHHLIDRDRDAAGRAITAN